jgi:hypothetical protein
MRVIGYPGLKNVTDKDRVGVSCGEHTDYGITPKEPYKFKQKMAIGLMRNHYKVLLW